MPVREGLKTPCFEPKVYLVGLQRLTKYFHLFSFFIWKSLKHTVYLYVLKQTTLTNTTMNNDTLFYAIQIISKIGGKKTTAWLAEVEGVFGHVSSPESAKRFDDRRSALEFMWERYGKGGRMHSVELIDLSVA